MQPDMWLGLYVGVGLSVTTRIWSKESPDTEVLWWVSWLLAGIAVFCWPAMLVMRALEREMDSLTNYR